MAGTRFSFFGTCHRGTTWTVQVLSPSQAQGCHPCIWRVAELWKGIQGVMGSVGEVPAGHMQGSLGVAGPGHCWRGVLRAPTLLALAQLPTAAVSASSLEGLDGMELDELPTQVTLRFCGSLTQMWVL